MIIGLDDLYACKRQNVLFQSYTKYMFQLNDVMILYFTYNIVVIATNLIAYIFFHKMQWDSNFYYTLVKIYG